MTGGEKELTLRSHTLLLRLLVLLLRGTGVFLLGRQASAPARVLFLVGHLYHLLSIRAGLTYIRIP